MRTAQADSLGDPQVFRITASSLTFGGGVATFTATAAHKLTTGQKATISGADQEQYNGTFTVTVTGSTTFTYVPTNTPTTTPATGTILAQRALPASAYDPFVLVDRSGYLMTRPGNVTKTWAVLDATSGLANAVSAFTGTSTLVRRAIVKAAAGNSAAVLIGPNNTPTWASLSAGDEYLIEAPAGLQFDLAAWYFKSTGAAQSISILYV